MGAACAESRDGIRFTKPVLNLVERNDSKANNLALPPGPMMPSLGGATIWRDANPSAAPGARFKSRSKMHPKPGSPIHGPHRVWKPPDGLRWTYGERTVSGLRAADDRP